jgi:hypothetical protein
MRFMVLVKSDARSEAGVLPDEKLLSEMGSYNEGLIRAGAMLAGEGLKPSSQGARVRISQGKTRHIDGPFAESKELVAGYWLLQFPSCDEAIHALSRAPFDRGELEVRPMYEPEDFALEAGGSEREQKDLDASEQPARRPEQEEATQKAGPPARIPGTTRFLCLLKADAYTEGDDKATPELLAEMGRLVEEMSEAGVLLMGEGLKPSRFGKRICFDEGKRCVTDGPFTESKELIAGVSLLQTRSLAEAAEWGRRMLDIHMRGVGSRAGEIELRPVFELEDFPVDPAEKPDGWRAKELAFRDGVGA